MNLFPFEGKRKHQDELMQRVKEVLEKQHHLIVNAPTGIGKTASVLIPALEFAIKNDLNVIFLTSRHTQHNIVMETLNQIKDKHNKKILVSDFVAKKWMCSQSGVEELRNSEFLEFCRDLKKNNACPYYNNVKKKSKKIVQHLSEISPLSNSEIIQIARSNETCPYEIACDFAKVSNVVIADYFHIFDPGIRQSILNKTGKSLDKSIIIVDEAHNLPNRLRDMLSSKLTDFVLSSAAKEAESVDEVKEIVNKIEIIVEMLASEVEKSETLIDRQYFIDLIEKDCEFTLDEVIYTLNLFGEEVRKNKKRSFCSSIAHFLESWKTKSDNYARILRKSKREFRGKEYKKTEIELFCLDPSVISMPVIMESYSTIIMSGTLNPTYMYKQVLGFPEQITEITEFPCPFPQENRLAMIMSNVSTKYERRGEKQYDLMAKNCALISNSAPGNIAIFFPSYYLRDVVYERFESLSKKEIILEMQDMSKQEKFSLFEKFKSRSKEGAVLLAVSGASFSEGVDLPGDYLQGVIIVGIPLEHPDLKTEMLVSHYDKKFNAGWEYVYTVPAINRSLQAAGRCIRSESDKGVIVLMDERFTWSKYFRFIPKYWKFMITPRPDEKIKEFFNPLKSP